MITFAYPATLNRIHVYCYFFWRRVHTCFLIEHFLQRCTGNEYMIMMVSFVYVYCSFFLKARPHLSHWSNSFYFIVFYFLESFGTYGVKFTQQLFLPSFFFYLTRKFVIKTLKQIRKLLNFTRYTVTIIMQRIHDYEGQFCSVWWREKCQEGNCILTSQTSKSDAQKGDILYSLTVLFSHKSSVAWLLIFWIYVVIFLVQRKIYILKLVS